MALGRERVSQAWRDLHEAVYYAADATGCAQFIQFADLQSRRGDSAADLESLRCMHKAGRLTGDEVLRYQRLSATHDAIMRTPMGRPDTEPEAATVRSFVAEAGDVETQVWRLVPDTGLPGGMRETIIDPQDGHARVMRRGRRRDVAGIE